MRHPPRHRQGRHRPAWKRELDRAVGDVAGLSAWLALSEAEREGLAQVGPRRPVQVSPAYARQMDRRDPADPLRQQVLPRTAELVVGPGESGDPLAELGHQPVPALIHRYPDRALLLVTGQCASYCRFCTRSRLAGHPPPDLEPAFRYLAEHREVREVIVSGGDPLVLPDAELERIFKRLRAIKHVEVLRLGTRLPVFAPRRITVALTRVLARARPLFVLVHVNHPREVNKGFRSAVGRLVDAGLPVLSQTVLLRGINDDADTLEQLFRALLRARVVPYYLHQCDLAAGTASYRVPLDEGLALVGVLRDRMSGLAVPDYVIDLPEAGGKVLLAPERVVERREDGHLLRAIDGREIWVPAPS